MDPRGALRKLGHPGGCRAAVRKLAVPGTAAAVGARLLPSTLVLTQWLPDAALDIRDIPGVCRWRGPVNDRREVALTFDDAPDPRSTVETLRALERLQLRATFFCLGRSAERDGGLVREICARGHEIAAHGYEHERHVVHSRRWVKRDVARSVDLLEGLGVRPAFFRPSYGLVTGASISAARMAGLELVLWSAWGREWVDRAADSVARRVLGRLNPGAIVLLHDSDVGSPPGTADRARWALGPVSEALAERRLVAVTMSELVSK